MEGLEVGDWTFGELLGRGGQGTVFSAQRRLLKSEFAVKVVRSSLEDNDAWSFSREAEIACALAHPNITRTYLPFQGPEPGLLCLPMERLFGEPLSDRLRRERRAPWDPTEAAQVILQAARALAFAHTSGVVHRDIKPSNIFLGEHGVVKVLDFGLARSTEATQTNH